MKSKQGFLPNKMNKYSIRKFTVGTASLLIGATLVFGVGSEAQAAELDAITTNDSGSNKGVALDISDIKSIETETQNVENGTISNANDVKDTEGKEENPDIDTSKLERENTEKVQESKNVVETTKENTNIEPSTDNKNQEINEKDTIENNVIEEEKPTNEKVESENTEITNISENTDTLKTEEKTNDEKNTSEPKTTDENKPEMTEQKTKIEEASQQPTEPINEKVQPEQEIILDQTEMENGDNVNDEITPTEQTSNEQTPTDKSTADSVLIQQLSTTTDKEAEVKTFLNSELSEEETKSIIDQTNINFEKASNEEIKNEILKALAIQLANEQDANTILATPKKTVLRAMAAPTAITTADATNEQVDKSLGYVDNYTFASLIFDPKTLSSQGALDSKEIDFNIDSYMSGANSGDRYKIDLKLDPIIAKHVTKISVNPANRSKPVEFVRLTDDQGNLTNTWEVNFIRANNGLFGGAEILSQYSAENGKIYLDDTVRNIINEVGDLSNNKLNYQMFVRDSSENKIVRTTESSGYFLTNADSDLIQLQNKISTANSKSFTSSSGSAVFNSDIGNNGGIIIDQQVMKDGIFSYNTAGNKQWSYNYQIDKDLLPYIESAELHIYDYVGLAGFDKTYYASNKVADLTLDTIGNGKITSENLNDLISFNNSLPETVGMRIVLKLNQSVNNILTKEALYDSVGNLISETTKQKEDFTFAGYLTDNGGMLINNTMGTSTVALQDYDKDGLLDRYERQVSLSDAEVLDTDADGKNDGDEVVNYKTSPLVGLPVVADINMADTIVSGSVPLKAGAVSQTAKVINADNQIIGSATVNSDGSFAIVIPSSPAGEYTIAIDSPNYVNDEVSKFNIIDNTIVPTPTIDPVDDNDTVIVVHGATGSTVTVTDNHNNVIGTVKITNDTTSGSITLSTPLEAGTVLTSTASENGKISDSSKTITVTDATAPDAPIINTVTSEDTQVSGTAEPGTSVRINFPGGGYTAITTDSNGNYTIDIPDGVILEGGESITATSKDDAGNISETATTIVTDITAPETPTVEELTSEDTQVNGTAEPNSEVTVTFPDGTTATGTTDEEGNYTIDIPTNIDLVGGEEVKVVATDKDGNVSEEGTTTVTDVTAPDAPTVEEVTSEDTQVSGTAEPNSEVTVTFPDGTTVTGTTDEDGNYTVDIPEKVELEGGEEVKVVATDKDGNVSEEGTTTVTDVTAPDAPTVEEVTSEDTQVSGTAEPNSEVTVTFPDGTTVTGTTDEEGNYIIDIPENVELEGGEEITVTSTDKDGNISESTKVIVINKEETPNAGETPKTEQTASIGEKSNTNEASSKEETQSKSQNIMSQENSTIEKTNSNSTVNKNTTNSSINKGESKRAHSNKLNSENELPETGQDETRNRTLFGTLIAGLGGLLLLVMRRRKKEEDENKMS
ncbi:MAG: Ig-like domain-containing protein [Staphylococcus equorum]